MDNISLKKILEDIAKALVDNPEAVNVEETNDEEGVRLILHVAEDDMGKVIGKQGKIAKSIRTLMKAASAKENKKILVDIE